MKLSIATYQDFRLYAPGCFAPFVDITGWSELDELLIGFSQECRR